jgi:endonuclease-3
VLTVLSQHTSDTNRDRAFAGLKQRFPSWESVAAARTTELADAIRSGGIADVKAGRIKGILDEILEQEGALSLDRLNELTDEEVERYLVALPGVGPKTAACVLVFAMGRDAFPIDTHVYRIAARLGWIGPKVTADAAHRMLTPRIPPEIRYDLHVALIDHGRSVCKPQLPRCTECVLFDLCDAGPRFLAAGEAR